MKILKKLVSVLVASCFCLSIVNLPVFADKYDNAYYETGSIESYNKTTYTTPAQAMKASSDRNEANTKKTTEEAETKETITTISSSSSQAAKQSSNNQETKTTESSKTQGDTIVIPLPVSSDSSGVKETKTTESNESKNNTIVIPLPEEKVSSNVQEANTTVTEAVTTASSAKSTNSIKNQNNKKQNNKKQNKTKVTAKSVNKLATQNINLINKLLKIKGISSSAKKWLKEAKKYINSIKKGKTSNAKKYATLQKTLKSLQTIQKAGKNNLGVIVNETLKKGSVFSSLGKKVLNKDTTYKTYKSINTSIDNLLKTNISEEQKKWLRGAKKLVQNEFNKGNTTWLTKAQASINNIAKEKASIEVLLQKSAFSSVDNTEINQIKQISNTYSAKGVKVISALSKNLGLGQYQIYQQFVKAGVTDDKLTEVADTILAKIESGENFINTSAVALAKYLKIDKKSVAVQQLAVAIVNGSDLKNNSKGHDTSLTLEDQLAVVKLNNNKNTDIYEDYTLDEFMANLKNGESAIVYVSWSDAQCSIVVTKQNENSYIITEPYTVNSNMEPVKEICTAKQFKAIMNNEGLNLNVSVDEIGWSNVWNVRHNAVNADGKIRFISNSEGIKENEDKKLKAEYVEPTISLINKLLNTEGISEEAKAWLSESKNIVNNIVNSKSTVSNETKQLKKALMSIQKIVEQNASSVSLLQESSNGSIFSSLRNKILKNDDEISNKINSIFVQYAQPCLSIINNLLDSDNLNESAEVLLNAVWNLITNTMDDILNGLNVGNDNFSKQIQWLQQAQTSLEQIKNNDASIQILIKETSNDSAFSPLRDTLENTTTYQAYQMYGSLGVKVINTLAKYIKVLESVVFQQFVRFGVTISNLVEQEYGRELNAGELLLAQIKNGINLFNCTSLAVSEYLGISRVFAALQNLSADIANGKYYEGNPDENDTTIGINTLSISQVLKMNGIENVEAYYYKYDLDNFIYNFKEGAKAVFKVDCFNGGGHAITIIKEGPDSFGVYDCNLNGGKEVIYTTSEFINLMDGLSESVTGKDAVTGKNVTKKTYYWGTDEYENLFFITDSENVENMVKFAA